VKKGYIRIPREERVCSECKESFTVLSTSPQKYCSRTCSGNVAIRNATVRYSDKRSKIHRSIKKYIIQWSIENKMIVSKTPLNKIKTTLAPLLDDIHQQFGVKDFRVISKAVFGEDRGRKELIKFMKNVCSENVC
jgi:hypothetical protein